MREFERDDLFGDLSGGLEFEPKVAPIGGRKLDRHIAVEGLEVGPNGDSVLLAKLGNAVDELWQFLVMNLTILERAEVEALVRLGENSVPMVEALFQCQRVLAGLLGTLGVWRDQNWQVGFSFAVLADVVVNFDNVGIVFACLVGQVPPSKALVVAVSGVGFVDERLVQVDLLPPCSPPPVKAGIVRAEVQIEANLIGQRIEHFADVLVHRQ